MANDFKRICTPDIGTSLTTIYAVPAGSGSVALESIVIGITLANKSASSVTASIFIDNEDGTRKYTDMNTDIVMHGLIAQEVKEAMDKAGCDTFGGWKEDSNGQQEVSKAMFVIPLIKAVQQLSAQVETLTAEVSALKGE